ncbi:hypothetical protein DESC_790016 [Desulfosarcina cetonica]|nr:hypothetical protein DESC_790016 [Desulfosarcina cetonica]
MAPAKIGENPFDFIIGIINDPTVAVSAVGLPDIMPKRAAAKFPIWPAAPFIMPKRDIDISTKNFAAPDAFKNEPNITNCITSVATTAMGVPSIPSSVKQKVSTISL